MKMKNGKDVRNYIQNVFNIVDEINEMDMKVIDNLLIILLLYSIPDEYESFRIAIEIQEKWISPAALKIKLLEEFESRKRCQVNTTTETMFVKGSTNATEPSRERFKFTCHACGKAGHKAWECKSKR